MIVNLHSGEQQRSGTGTGPARQTTSGKQLEMEKRGVEWRNHRRRDEVTDQWELTEKHSHTLLAQLVR